MSKYTILTADELLRAAEIDAATELERAFLGKFEEMRQEIAQLQAENAELAMALKYALLALDA